MSKIIKKQLYRSLPWLVIVTMLSLTAGGLFFNLNLSLVKSGVRELTLRVGFGADVQAFDFASTTVTVRNAPPAFSVAPVEVPVSSSTAPVNIGGTQIFQATGDDPEGNSYRLLVCSSLGASAVNGGAPTCAGTQMCVSALTADEAQATCIYSNVIDPVPAAEIDDWYAYVCDNHGSEADCSPVSQGAGDSGSPLYINHPAAYSEIVTTVNNQAPGGTFTFTASSTDNDSQGGNDVLELYVCTTNSWATSTGCAATQLCYGTSTSPNVDCSFTDTAPTADQNYAYYGFVKDWHGLAASGTSQTNTYTIINVAPAVSNVIINSGNNITVNIKGAAEVIASTSSVSLSDNNGCADIIRATGTIYLSSTSQAYLCAPNDNNCYQIAQSECWLDASTCTGADDFSVSAVCTTTLAYHATPTDNSTGNPRAGDDWLGAIRAFDEALSGVATTTTGVDVRTNTALEVTEVLIPYGSLRNGEDTGTTNATTTVINYGNSPLNSDVIGTDMARDGGGGLIGANYQEYAINNFDYESGTDLSSTTPANVNILAPKPTDQTNVSDEIFWGIAIPIGTISGEYYGSNTFTGTLDSTNWL